MSSCLSDHHYELPPELIADRPAPRRQDSRMLVLHRESGRIEHRGFADLREYISPQDLLVLNDSKVIPARLHDASGKIEMLLLEQRETLHWTAMVRPGKKMREGASVEVARTTATVSEVLDDGTRLLEFSAPPSLTGSRRYRPTDFFAGQTAAPLLGFPMRLFQLFQVSGFRFQV